MSPVWAEGPHGHCTEIEFLSVWGLGTRLPSHLLFSPPWHQLAACILPVCSLSSVRRIRRNFLNVFLKDFSPVSPAVGLQRCLLMPLLTLVSSLVWLVQSRGGRHPFVWHRGWAGCLALLFQDGASRVGSAIDRSGAMVQTSVVNTQGPQSSAWHWCRECPLGCETLGLGSPGTCSGKEPKVHFLM